MSTYYQYMISGSLYRYIGNPPQIIMLLMHYHKDGFGVKYPLDSDFKRLEHLTIPCSLPVSNPEHIIRIELTDKVTLEVNVNAWIDIQMQFLNYKNLFRGSLYKLEPKKPGLLENGFFFLPEEVMRAGKEYDWDKHAKEVGELLRQRETSLIEMEQKGHFYKKQEMRH